MGDVVAQQDLTGLIRPRRLGSGESERICGRLFQGLRGRSSSCRRSGSLSLRRQFVGAVTRPETEAAPEFAAAGAEVCRYLSGA